MRIFRRKGREKSPLHTRILLGLALGSVLGLLSNVLMSSYPVTAGVLNWLLDNAMAPIGQIFLRMLFMIVVPLVFASLTLGVAGLGDVRRLGKMAMATFGYFLMVTALAVTLGLVLVNTFKPGSRMDPETRDQLMSTFGAQAEQKMATRGEIGPDFFVNIIPRNPIEAAARGDMLSLIFVAIITGVALTMIGPHAASPFLKVLESIGKVTVAIIDIAMKLAPLGVFCLIFNVTARFGWGILRELASYVFVVLLGLTVFQILGYSVLIRVFSGIRPGDFFRRVRTVMVTAFSTSSSSATLPTTMKTAEEDLGVPNEVASFVLPLGATMNMNGTALFEGVTVMFLAQVFGVHLDLPHQLVVVLLSVLSAVGSAGVPGGSIPLLAAVLTTVGVPGTGIALIIGVDRILDMSRTVLNVTGDLSAATFVTRWEKRTRKAEAAG